MQSSPRLHSDFGGMRLCGVRLELVRRESKRADTESGLARVFTHDPDHLTE